MIAEGLDLTPISERQLRERLKKSVIFLENQQRSFFSYFLSLSKDKVISADKMMNKAKGPIWHKKHKEKGFILRKIIQGRANTGHHKKYFRVKPLLDARFGK